MKLIQLEAKTLTLNHYEVDSCNWTDLIGLRGAAHDWQDIMRRCYLMHGRRCGASVHDTELSHGISNPQLVHQTPQLLTEEWSGFTIKYVHFPPLLRPLTMYFPRVISYNITVKWLFSSDTSRTCLAQSSHCSEETYLSWENQRRAEGNNIIRAGPVQCLTDRA